MSSDYRNQGPTPPEGWEKIQDIRWFAEHITSNQFRALSSGLGLGALKPVGARAQRSYMPSTAPAPEQMRPVVLPVVPPMRTGRETVHRSKRGQQRNETSAHQSSNPVHQSSNPVVTVRSSYSRILSAWVFDFMVVVLSLAVAFGFAVVLSMVKTGETDNWLALRPVKFLSARRPVEILASVYAMFAVYMIVFKFGAGKTVGELIFMRKKAKHDPSVTH